MNHITQVQYVSTEISMEEAQGDAFLMYHTGNHYLTQKQQTTYTTRKVLTDLILVFCPGNLLT